MRVTTVTLYAVPGEEVITFSLRDSDPRAQYVIRNMVGLDAEELIPKFYGSGLYTKPKFFDFGLKAREIVARIILNPRIRIDESYSDIRDELYRAISSTRTGQVTLHFNSGATTVSQISGFITKFEVPYFTQLPEVQITIRCDDPMFRGINPVEFEPADMKTVNPIIIADSLSTAPHGFCIELTFKAAAPSFTIQDVPTNPEWLFKVVPSGGFLIGDKLYFSSEFANKYLYMVRAGVTTYLTDRIQPNSIWPILFPGSNSFHFVDIASFNWNEVDFYPAYWGV
jgi:hypothetical protein